MIELVTAHFAQTAERSGWVRIVLVDEHGCPLHTEPVCSVFVGDTGHRWFAEWLLEQECPRKLPSLLTHLYEE